MKQNTFPSIRDRIDRLKEGLAGDTKQLGHGINELRIHYGPGYRVYFHRHEDTLILLLCGGRKASQNRDIRRARSQLKAWRDNR
ncbi:addiction module killer protein [Alcanivorax sp. N3-2A]|nr:addiction module killer protein [Alcanivorax sp. N3-2A]